MGKARAVGQSRDGLDSTWWEARFTGSAGQRRAPPMAVTPGSFCMVSLVLLSGTSISGRQQTADVSPTAEHVCISLRCFGEADAFIQSINKHRCRLLSGHPSRRRD